VLVKKTGLLVLQRKKMYVAVVPLKKRGCAAEEEDVCAEGEVG
jgi:hypothetical protein